VYKIVTLMRDDEAAALPFSWRAYDVYEENAVLGLLCRIGVHRWRALELMWLEPERDIHHCFWCTKVRIDGIVYDV